MVVGGLVLWGLPARRSHHFTAYRRVPRTAEWEFVDSVGSVAEAVTEELALHPSLTTYFVVHTDHGACGLLPNIGPVTGEA